MKNILAATVLLFPLAAWAQDIKPFDAKTGLWEYTTLTEISGMPAMPAMPGLTQEQLDKIPAAQRAQVEAAMKGRGSMGSPRTATTKTCMTKESLGKSLYDRGDKSCVSKLVSSSSNAQVVHLECTTAGMKTTGDVSVERVDNEHFKGNMLLKTSGGDAGRSMDMKMTISGKWLAADCGSVKPLEAK